VQFHIRADGPRSQWALDTLPIFTTGSLLDADEVLTPELTEEIRCAF